VGSGPRRSRGATALALAGAAALGVAGPEASGAPRPLLLPSPVTPLDAKVPLSSDAPRTQLQLPLNARLDSRERVLVRTLPDGRVVAVRAVQRLTLTGTGDYFLSIPAPLLDVRAAPGSQAEPGFRRSGILWQGFANRRRVLAADATIDPARAAEALPLHLELRTTVDGRALQADERRSGRLELELRLRNTTGVRVRSVSAPAAQPNDVREVVTTIASEISRGETPEQPAVDVDGPTTTREVLVDAPLAVAGEVRLPVRRLRGAAVSGGSLERGARGAVVRFRLVLASPEQPSARIVLTGAVTDAGAPRTTLRAEPSTAATLAGADEVSTTREAGVLLLRLARVRQYDAFLTNPAPGGSVEALYRFETTAPRSTATAAPASDEDSAVVPVLVVIALVVGAGGLVALWARL
jgi:hypothetical protein